MVPDVCIVPEGCIVSNWCVIPEGCAVSRSCSCLSAVLDVKRRGKQLLMFWLCFLQEQYIEVFSLRRITSTTESEAFSGDYGGPEGTTMRNGHTIRLCSENAFKKAHRVQVSTKCTKFFTAAVYSRHVPPFSILKRFCPTPRDAPFRNSPRARQGEAT